MLIIKAYYHVMAIIKKIIYKLIYGKRIKFGKKVTFRRGFSLMIDKNAKVEIGDGTFFNNYCSINAINIVKIGKNCLFGENVKIYDHNHIFNKKTIPIKEQGFKSEAVSIGDDCWICSNVIILKSSKIGNNSVIGAGCVISDSVDDNLLVKNNNSYEITKIERKNNE